MRADAADRIFAAPPPEVTGPQVSVPRLFALAFVLPFTHLPRLILARLAPAALILGVFLLPPSRAAVDHVTSAAQGAAGGLSPIALASLAPLGWVLLTLFLAAMLLFCAWQRGVARGFTEPFGRWQFQSVLRVPGYVLALLVWQGTPLVVTLPASYVIGETLKRNMLMAEYGVPNGLGVSAGMLTPVQWWVASIGTLTFSLVGLWLSARLLPLPALAASRGWRGSLERAWRISAGHGFGISVSMLGYTLVGFLVPSAIVFPVAAPMPAVAAMPALPELQIIGIAGVVAAVLVLLWYTAFAALLVRETGSPDDALEFTAFD